MCLPCSTKRTACPPSHGASGAGGDRGRSLAGGLARLRYRALALDRPGHEDESCRCAARSGCQSHSAQGGPGRAFPITDMSAPNSPTSSRARTPIGSARFVPEISRKWTKTLNTSLSSTRTAIAFALPPWRARCASRTSSAACCSRSSASEPCRRRRSSILLAGRCYLPRNDRGVARCGQGCGIRLGRRGLVLSCGAGRVWLAALTHVDGWDGDYQRRLLVATIAALWSCRLGIHILRRTLNGGEDPRYAKLHASNGRSAGVRVSSCFCRVQAAAALLLTATIFTAARNPANGLHWSDAAGIAIHRHSRDRRRHVADAQLAQFRSKAAPMGARSAIMASGACRDIRTISSSGLDGQATRSSPSVPAGVWGWGLALAGPAFMYWLLVHVSGIPPLEAHMMRSRGVAFAAYVRTRQCLLAWPPKEGSR
jgi:steroid 5-alpha reductase family enzyme